MNKNKPKPKTVSHSLSIVKNTKDDWCPSYPGNKVKLSFYSTIRDKYTQFRVCCWGKDDLGMERDFNTEMQARLMFIYLSGLSFINFNHLQKLNFEYA